jgi:2-iminoacetate synthase
MVYGEHPKSDVHYMADQYQGSIFSRAQSTCQRRISKIRRVNVNAALWVSTILKILKQSGIGTYQVFQETYHRETLQEGSSFNIH